MKNYRKLRIITLISHLLIISFIAFFIKFEGKFNYIYDAGLMKNTQSRLIDLIFAVLLLVHFILIVINLVVLLKKVLKKQLRAVDLFYSLYPILILLIITGFDINNLVNILKAPFNIIIALLTNSVVQTKEVNMIQLVYNKQKGIFMDLEFIFNHVISGYLPIMALLILYFIILKSFGNTPSKGHIILTFIFSFYLVGVLSATGVCLKANFSPRFSLLPFIDMIRGPKDAVLNVILFLPLGIFLPLLYEQYNSLSKVLLLGFLFSLSIEIIQIFGFGTTDINDLITNTFGAVLGYGVFELLSRSFSDSLIGKFQTKGKYSLYEPVILWTMTILIMLTIQLYIYNILFASKMSGEIQKW